MLLLLLLTNSQILYKIKVMIDVFLSHAVLSVSFGKTIACFDLSNYVKVVEE